jgi:hypothetical protein
MEVGMTQEPVDERRYFTLRNAHHDQAVAWMAETRHIESGISGEERDSSLRAKKNDNLLVLQSLVPKIYSDLPSVCSRRLQQQALPFENILIEAASEIASEGTSPRHSSTIVSQAIPAPTWSRTSATRIRVPRNVGWP